MAEAILKTNSDAERLETAATKRAALIVATLSSFLGPFMSSSVNVALPSIGGEFGMGAVALGWVNTAFLLSAATFLIPFGRLGDIYGRKKIYIWGTVIFTISSVLLANSVSGMMVILLRVLQGFGSSLIFATGTAILISVYPPGERGKVLGITVAAVYLGLSTGPFFGGFITEQLSWRYIFWLNLPIGMLLVAVIAFMLKGEWAHASSAKFDLAGSALFGVSLLSTMYGFSRLPWPMAFVMVMAGILGIVLFVRYESRVADPVLDIDLFRKNTVFAFSNLAALVNYAATFAVTFLLSLYLQKTRGLSPQQAGLILISQPLVQAALSPLAGRLSDRIEPRTVASAGMALNFVGLVFLVFLNASTSLIYIIFCLVFLGLGFALFTSPNTNAIMSSVGRQHFGIAAAMVATMRQIGMIVSMAIVMMLLAILLGQAEITVGTQAQFVESMKIAFVLFAVLCFGGVFASLARGRMREK